MLNKLNEDRPDEERYTYAFGVCIYPQHEIWINTDACIEQQIRTLRHELTHCFYGIVVYIMHLVIQKKWYVI
jgi:Zn-dependent peptidase ImmA (M78 family)